MYGQFLLSEFENLGNESNGAYGEVPVAETDFFVQESESLRDVIGIEEGFPHSHKYDVANSAFGERLEKQVLANDFGNGEVSVESTEAGCAEFTSHGATHLTRDAATHTVLIWQQYTFKYVAIAIVNQQFFDSIGAFFVAGHDERVDLEIGSK